MRQWIRLAIYIAEFLCIGGLIWYIDGRFRISREDIALQEQTLQDIPAQIAQTSMLERDFSALQEKMKEIYAQTPTRDQLPEAIATISAAAADAGVAMQVPIVGEDAVSPAGTGDAESDDAFSDVRIHIVASGNPANIMAFLYRVEHLPYVLHFVSWSVDTTRQVAVSTHSGIAPEETGAQSSALRGSSLEADIIIVIRKK